LANPSKGGDVKPRGYGLILCQSSCDNKGLLPKTFVSVAFFSENDDKAYMR